MDLSTLDQETRCFVLIGQFFHTWANMERALHAATGYALNIDATKVQILAVNIDFENKLYIINTLVDANQDFSADDRKQYSKTIEEFRKRGNRNMIAHTPFEPHATGVQFERVKAKGKLAAKTEVWDVKKFEEEAVAVNEFRTFLELLGSRFAARPLAEEAYRNAAQSSWYGHAWYGQSYYGMSPALMAEATRQSEEAQKQAAAKTP